MLKERQDKIMKSERLTMQVNSEFADIFKSSQMVTGFESNK